MDGGEIEESRGCKQRFLSSLTENREQGTSVSQGSSCLIKIEFLFPTPMQYEGDRWWEEIESSRP